MNSAVEEVKSRINVVDLIGEYVRMTKAGTNWKANCPFHREKSPSFMVSEEKQIWHCFGCGKGGDAFGFIMEMESLEFPEAIKILAEKAGVDLSKYQFKKDPVGGERKSKGMEILELATRFYEKQLWDGVGKEKILPYLLKRGLTADSIREFRLGYAPEGWRNALTFLSNKGYSLQDIEATGLLVRKTGENSQQAAAYYDRFRDRIVFPIRDVMGRVAGFTGRVAPGGDESQAKYVNTPETLFYHKSKILYGLDKAKHEIKNNNFVLVVEGNMDVIAAHQAGMKNTIAVSGTALTSEQIDILKRYTENIKLLFDMDAAGEEATKRSAMLGFQKELNISVVRLSEGKDAAELVANNPDAFIHSAQGGIPAMGYFINGLTERYDIQSPENKKIVAKECLAFINEMKSEIDRDYWLKALSEKIGVTEQVLRGILPNKSALGNQKEQVKTNVAREMAEKKGRKDFIQEKMIGLMLADHAAWKKTVQEPELLGISSDHPLMRFVLENGSAAGFQVDQLISLVADKEIKNNLQQLYFNTRYRIIEGGEIEENDLSGTWDELKKCSVEFDKESKKNKLKKIMEDIALAEKNGDKEGLQILISEFSKLSQELK